MNRRVFLVTGTAMAGAAFRGFAESPEMPLDQWLAEEQGVGVAYAKSVVDVGVARGAAGLMRLGGSAPYTVDTIQNIASVSKTVTATAAMQLVEQGALTLDGDINAHLPFSIRHPKHADTAITLRMLLSHQAAILDGTAYDLSYACGDPAQSLEAWIHDVFAAGGAFSGQRRFHRHAPGEQHRYSNVGYGLIGYLVERASGQSFTAWCREQIFAPLGMEATGWMLADVEVGAHATPHFYLKRLPKRRAGGDRNLVETWPDEAPGFARFCLYSFPNYPDGLLRTNVTDFSKFLRVFAAGGQPLLKEESVAEMLRPHCAASDEPGHFQALCWTGGKDHVGNVLYGHSGGDPGVSTLAAFRPEDGMSACVFANANSSIVERVMDSVVR